MAPQRRDLYTVPGDLPVPEDDGAADHLLHARLPSVALPSTPGAPVDLAEASEQTLVLYVYPQTGTPGRPSPAGWDEVPGARGCTPENCAFRDHAQDLSSLGATVLGLSAQALEEQREFAERERIPYPLLNDSEFRLTEELGFPTFEVNGERYYRRLTLIARDGRVVKVFYPVFPPQENAGQVVAWLRGETS
jgi:peroxiredoxin